MCAFRCVGESLVTVDGVMWVVLKCDICIYMLCFVLCVKHFIYMALFKHKTKFDLIYFPTPL